MLSVVYLYCSFSQGFTSSLKNCSSEAAGVWPSFITHLRKLQYRSLRLLLLPEDITLWHDRMPELTLTVDYLRGQNFDESCPVGFRKACIDLLLQNSAALGPDVKSINRVQKLLGSEKRCQLGSQAKSVAFAHFWLKILEGVGLSRSFHCSCALVQ